MCNHNDIKVIKTVVDSRHDDNSDVCDHHNNTNDHHHNDNFKRLPANAEYSLGMP